MESSSLDDVAKGVMCERKCYGGAWRYSQAKKAQTSEAAKCATPSTQTPGLARMRLKKALRHQGLWRGKSCSRISWTAFPTVRCAWVSMWWRRKSDLRTARLKSKVLKNAPTKPSTVFLGESLISGVRPRVIPDHVMSMTIHHVHTLSLTPYICENVIANHKGSWYPEPNQTLPSEGVKASHIPGGQYSPPEYYWRWSD